MQITFQEEKIKKEENWVILKIGALNDVTKRTNFIIKTLSVEHTKKNIFFMWKFLRRKKLRFFYENEFLRGERKNFS